MNRRHWVAELLILFVIISRDITVHKVINGC